jgi:hypothetical protein
MCYLQPKYDTDRISIADDCIKATGYRLPLLIDPVSVDNIFNKVIVYGQFDFICFNGMRKLSYIALPMEGSYPLELIKNALDEAIQQCQ